MAQYVCDLDADGGDDQGAEGRLERWLEASANEPDPEGDEPFGEDESTPGVS